MAQTDALEHLVNEKPKAAVAVITSSANWNDPSKHNRGCHDPQLIGTTNFAEQERMQQLLKAETRTLQTLTENKPKEQTGKQPIDVEERKAKAAQQTGTFGRGSKNDYIGGNASPLAGNHDASGDHYFAPTAFGGQCACGAEFNATANDATPLNASTDTNSYTSNLNATASGNQQPYGVNVAVNSSGAGSLYGVNKDKKSATSTYTP